MPQSESKFIQQIRYGRTCKGCGAGFQASRPDAQCCNATCRQKYKRKCDAITRASVRDNPNVPAMPFFRDAEPASIPAQIADPTPVELVEESRKNAGVARSDNVAAPSRPDPERPVPVSSVTKPKKPRPSAERARPTRSKPGWKPTPQAVKFVKVMKKVAKLPLNKGAALIKKVKAKKGGKSK